MLIGIARLTLAALIAGAPVPVFAQAPRPNADQKPAENPPAPPLRIEDLFEKLKAAKDVADARNFADQIQRIWSRSGSDTADLLMKRTTQAVEKKDSDLALDLLDSILALEPQWPEAWYRRAVVHIMREDLDSAMRDLNTVLTREPRHFRAWTQLGFIMMKVDRKKTALEAFKRAHELHPHEEQIEKTIERIGKDVEGEKA